jgi:hypothetical protein
MDGPAHTLWQHAMGLIFHNDVKKLAPNVCTGKAEGAQSSQAVVAIRDGVGVE